jgi:hypothetical protein
MRKVALLFAICATLFSATGVRAEVILPGASSYRIAFVTSGVRNASSTNINDYNSFVTAQAVGSGIDLALAAFGATPSWSVWGSTASVNAIDNVKGNGADVADLQHKRPTCGFWLVTTPTSWRLQHAFKPHFV